MANRFSTVSNAAKSLAILFAVAGIAVTVAFERGSLAQGNVIERRQDVMSEFDDIGDDLNDLTRRDRNYDAARVAELAGRIHELSADLTSLFPEGSTHEDSNALPAIWENWQEFTDRAASLHEESGKLAELAAGGADRSDVRAQFARTGRVCGDCHDRFRAED